MMGDDTQQSAFGGRYDVVVVGSGIAGLYAALLAAPHSSVLLLTKGRLEESNTRYAQGGIAVALAAHDSPELHLRDTIAAGDGLTDPQIAAILTREAPACIVDLLHRGVPFDRDGEELAFTLEAAHSLPRVLHAGGDATGARIEQTLAAAMEAAGVTIREDALCTSLLLAGGRVRGIRLFSRSGEHVEVGADHVILASGGAGQLYARTTNPAVATGDGLAIAYRAGAELMDLEFMQFHPTALALEGAPSFLISEAVRGEGGILRDARGKAFMVDYHPDRELAPRDVVARAIHQQMIRTSSSHVLLDITHLPREKVERRFPSIVGYCRRHGIDPIQDPIPVAPAAHYLMGGIRTDSWARTSIPGLLACGEVACTGVHGANRLASNSLLEGLVFARRAVATMVRGDAKMGIARAPGRDLSLETVPAPAVESDACAARSRQELANVMWRLCSLVRSTESLQEARGLIAPHPRAGYLHVEESGSSRTGRQETRETGKTHTSLLPSPARERGNGGEGSVRAQYELANMTLLSALLVESALLRRESRGAHYRSDFAQSDPAWQGRIVVSREGARLSPLGLTERPAAA